MSVFMCRFALNCTRARSNSSTDRSNEQAESCQDLANWILILCAFSQIKAWFLMMTQEKKTMAHSWMCALRSCRNLENTETRLWKVRKLFNTHCTRMTAAHNFNIIKRRKSTEKTANIQNNEANEKKNQYLYVKIVQTSFAYK